VLDKFENCKCKIATSAFQSFLFPQALIDEHVDTPWGNNRTAGLQQMALRLGRALNFRNSLNVNGKLNFIKVKQSRYRPGVAQRVPGS
jgi:hypothetical protein